MHMHITKQKGDKQSIRCTVENACYKDAQGTQDINSIKKIQSETKDTLIEIKNNLRGNNSRVDEAENQINNLEQKESKTTNKEQEEEKSLQTRTV